MACFPRYSRFFSTLTRFCSSGQIDLANLFSRSWTSTASAVCLPFIKRRLVDYALSSARFFNLTADGRINENAGQGAIFRPKGAAKSSLADVSTLNARRKAYCMLLTKCPIRAGLPMPANADFELVAVGELYGFATATELSLFYPGANQSSALKRNWLPLKFETIKRIS